MTAVSHHDNMKVLFKIVTLLLLLTIAYGADRNLVNYKYKNGLFPKIIVF